MSIEIAAGPADTESPLRKAGRMVLERTIDFAVHNLASGTVMEIFQVPAGYHVERIEAIVETAEGAACTADIGDYTVADGVATAVDADGFIDGLNCNSLARSSSVGTLTLGEATPNTVSWSPAYWQGKTYTADSMIGIAHASGADPINGAKVRFIAVVIDLV